MKKKPVSIGLLDFKAQGVTVVIHGRPTPERQPNPWMDTIFVQTGIGMQAGEEMDGPFLSSLVGWIHTPYVMSILLYSETLFTLRLFCVVYGFHSATRLPFDSLRLYLLPVSS